MLVDFTVRLIMLMICVFIYCINYVSLSDADTVNPLCSIHPSQCSGHVVERSKTAVTMVPVRDATQARYFQRDREVTTADDSYMEVTTPDETFTETTTVDKEEYTSSQSEQVYIV